MYAIRSYYARQFREALALALGEHRFQIVEVVQEDIVQRGHVRRKIARHGEIDDHQCTI